MEGDELHFAPVFVDVLYEFTFGAYRCFVHPAWKTRDKYQVSLYDTGGSILDEPAKSIEDAIEAGKYKVEIITAIGGPNSKRHQTAYANYKRIVTKQSSIFVTQLLINDLL